MPIPKLSRHVYAYILGTLLVSILPALGAENVPAGWPPADDHDRTDNIPFFFLSNRFLTLLNSSFHLIFPYLMDVEGLKSVS